MHILDEEEFNSYINKNSDYYFEPVKYRINHDKVVWENACKYKQIQIDKLLDEICKLKKCVLFYADNTESHLPSDEDFIADKVTNKQALNVLKSLKY